MPITYRSCTESRLYTHTYLLTSIRDADHLNVIVPIGESRQYCRQTAFDREAADSPSYNSLISWLTRLKKLLDMNVIVVFFLLLSAFCPTNHTFLLKSPYCILNYRRIHDLQNPNANSNSAIFNKPISSQHFTSHVYDPERLIIPSPLDRIIDVNLERNAVVYEGSFNRDLGFDIVQGPETPVVGKVTMAIAFLLLLTIFID